MNLKGRYWAFILYPDSAPENWKDILSEMGVVGAISPLHDRDKNADGIDKKPHYHIVIEFEGPTTYKHVSENICPSVNATIPKRVVSLRGYYRYLTHMDNPEKAQYEEKDVIKIGGFTLDLTTTEVTALKVKIIEDITENNIVEYSDLLDYYLYQIGDIERLEIASNHTYFFDKYISSRRNKKYNEENISLHNIYDNSKKKTR